MGVHGLAEYFWTDQASDVRLNAILSQLHDIVLSQLHVTPRIHELVDHDLDLEERDRGSPLKQIGRPEELVDTVAFRWSRRSAFVDGVALPHDGRRMRSTCELCTPGARTARPVDYRYHNLLPESAVGYAHDARDYED